MHYIIHPKNPQVSHKNMPHIFYDTNIKKGQNRGDDCPHWRTVLVHANVGRSPIAQATRKRGQSCAAKGLQAAVGDRRFPAVQPRGSASPPDIWA